MKLKREIKAPFESGDLVQVKIDETPIVAEFRGMEGDRAIVRWGPQGARGVAAIPWWSGCYLYYQHPHRPWEDKVLWLIWVWYWLKYLPLRVRRLCELWKT